MKQSEVGKYQKMGYATSVPLLIHFMTVLNYVVQYYFVLALLYFARPRLYLGYRMDLVSGCARFLQNKMLGLFTTEARSKP